MPFCAHCGTENTVTQSFCSNCGSATTPPSTPAQPTTPPFATPAAAVREESGTGVFWCALLLGGWGIHQFMTGNNKRGIAYLLGCTLGSFLVIPPIIILVLIIIDLFAIARGDFHNADRTVRYKAAPWMKVVAILYIVLIPALIILGIVAAIAIPKFVGMSDKAQASEVGPAAGTWSKLQSGYYLETERVGTWSDIGYSAPGARVAEGVSETDNFRYYEPETGMFVAENKVSLGDCPAGNKWVAQFNADNANTMTFLPEDTDCAALTPNFGNF